MFHQRQKGSYCRCHALNNMIGREFISLSEFNKYCDEFDRRNYFSPGSSRNGHMFYNNGLTDNIFGYILEKKGIKIKMDHYDFYRPKKIKHCEKGTIGYIVYNMGHTWCVRVVNGEYYLIDSMRGGQRKINNLAGLERKGVGVIKVDRI